MSFQSLWVNLQLHNKRETVSGCNSQKENITSVSFLTSEGKMLQDKTHESTFKRLYFQQIQAAIISH